MPGSLQISFVRPDDLLNIDSKATIDVIGAQKLSGFKWQYWGKDASVPGDASWQPPRSHAAGKDEEHKAGSGP